MTNLRFQDIPILENDDAMVNLCDYPFIRDPVYFHAGWSNTPDMFLRQTLAEKLQRIQQQYLTPKDMIFCIRDPYRSRVVQANIYNHYLAIFREKFKHLDEAGILFETAKFVTKPDDPHRIPPHATGGSVDVAIYHRNGTELDMGTAFDHFGIESAPYYFEEDGRDTTIRDNRRFLMQIMQSENFSIDPDEWWHFDYGNQKWALTTNATHAIYGEIIL